jgi:hypothetical protein
VIDIVGRLESIIRVSFIFFSKDVFQEIAFFADKDAIWTADILFGVLFAVVPVSSYDCHDISTVDEEKR